MCGLEMQWFASKIAGVILYSAYSKIAVYFLVARHLYGYQKVLDGDSEVDRPDNYPPYNNQV